MMMYWKPFIYKGEVYDLTHLHPFEVIYKQPAKGNKPEQSYYLNVSFSLHCFTKRIEYLENLDDKLLYQDSREVRMFDFQRYQLSKSLKRMVLELDKQKCYHTGKGNFFIIEMIDEAGQKREYEVFFTMSHASNRGKLNLFVQSAYLRDEEHKANQPKKKPINFYVIAYNTLVGRPIKPAP